MVIGKVTSNSIDSDVVVDSSVFPKKGQLGFVDKSFITEGEEGTRIAKIRVREERVPAIGDKMASRAGQKGTLGLIIPEEDMPFTADGIRPDLIINPHALPSRMTIGQLIEALFGKACTVYGGYGDCTSFASKGPNTDVYGAMLVNAGYHSSGNQVLYNGMTGEQLYSDIYIGPTYYMRLKHMVKDKINYRALGPRTMLTRQTVQGRANDGGLRIGEMERDGIMAHGASAFLNESYMIRGDEYFMAVCNKTGAIAVYNDSLNLFMSPFADGPVKFNTTIAGKMNIKNVSKFGRSFSIVRVPYALKLLIQELQVMNVQMRIITEDNVEQLMSLSYSNNVNKLLNFDNPNTKVVYNKYTRDIRDRVMEEVEKDQEKGKKKKQVITPVSEEGSAEVSPPYAPTSPQYNPHGDGTSPPYAQTSPAYQPTSPQYNPHGDGTSPPYAPTSPQYNPRGDGTSPQYAQTSPAYQPNTPESPRSNVSTPYNPHGDESSPPYAPNSPAYQPNTPESPRSNVSSPYNPYDKDSDTNTNIKISNPEIKSQYDALSDQDKATVSKIVNEQKTKQEESALGKLITNPITPEDKVTSILRVEEEKEEKEEKEKEENNSSSSSSSSSNSSETKKVKIQL